MHMNNEEYQTKIATTYTQMGFQAYQNSKILLRLFGKYCNKPILDVGAGDGSLIKLLLHKYPQCIGIDINPSDSIVKKASITNIPEENEVFNTVFCTEVLEHLNNRQIKLGLQEIRRVLKLNSNLILSVPFDEDLEQNSFICPHCEKKFHKVGHLQSFNKKNLKPLLETNGFAVLSIKIYALGAMSKLPLGKYFNWLFLKMNYDFIGKSLIAVCRKI